jgi:hypothetical protein
LFNSFFLLLDGGRTLCAARPAQPVQNIRLPVAGNRAVAGERRQYVFMSKVLAPSLELFGRLANFFAQSRKRVAEAMRVEIGQACCFERLPEYPANGACVAPTLSLQAGDFEMPAYIADFDSRGWKQRPRLRRAIVDCARDGSCVSAGGTTIIGRPRSRGLPGHRAGSNAARRF